MTKLWKNDSGELIKLGSDSLMGDPDDCCCDPGKCCKMQNCVTDTIILISSDCDSLTIGNVFEYEGECWKVIEKNVDCDDTEVDFIFGTPQFDCTTCVGCEPCSPSFTASVINCSVALTPFTPGCVGETVTWTYGDGEGGASNSHTYDCPGTYTIIMTAAMEGCPDKTYQDSITIPCPSLNPSITGLPDANCDVEFCGSATGSCGSQIVSWQWSMVCEGNTVPLGTGQCVTAALLNCQGTVTLIVVDECGCSDSVTQPYNCQSCLTCSDNPLPDTATLMISPNATNTLLCVSGENPDCTDVINGGTVTLSRVFDPGEFRSPCTYTGEATLSTASCPQALIAWSFSINGCFARLRQTFPDGISSTSIALPFVRQEGFIRICQCRGSFDFDTQGPFWCVGDGGITVIL